MSGGRSGGGGRNAANGKGSSTNNNGGVVGSIPQASKKMVQSLKEIVNCPEVEIYAMLKECNMDPNEAVNRLLSQDPFHEVKSKRDKKKENKDATDSRLRGGSTTMSRGARGGNDRYSRIVPSQFASSESGTSHAKPSYKKDNGPSYTSYSSVAGVTGSNINLQPMGASEVPKESKASTVGINEGVSSNPPSGFQSGWLGVPGQVSMADIVKMGRPHGRASSNVNPSEQIVNHHHVMAPKTAPTPHDLHSSRNYAAKVSEVSAMSGSENLPPDDEWPQDEQPETLGMRTISDPPVVSEPYEEPPTLSFDKKNHRFDKDQYVDADVDKHRLPSSRKMQEESSSSASVFNDDSYDNINSYQVHRHVFEQQEDEDIGISSSSVLTSIQQLSLSKEEEEEDSPRETDSPVVKIPEHLQAQSADCSHLSFGSFGSGMNAPSSGPFASGPRKSSIEEISTAADAASLEHTDARNLEFEDDENLRSASDEDSSHRLAASTCGYDVPSASPSEALKQEALEVSPENQYSFPPKYTFESSQHLDPSFSHSQTSSQMQDLSHSQTSSQMQDLTPLSGLMAYSNSLPSSLLPSNDQPVRDTELSYSPFPITQSMPTKYNSSVSSISGPTISMTEALKTVNFSSPQPTQNLPGSSILGGPAFPHLPVHPYSQPSLPFANMVSYPFLPQSYTYMPSAFQQVIAGAGNSTYHQSLAGAVPPQYKNSVAASSLPQSAAVPSGYGPFGSSNNVPGNFQLNPSPAAAGPSATSMSYEELLNSPYKDAAAHMLALQQGPGSRSMSAVPASTYYSLQGQSQQPAGYRQSQQPSQHFGNLGGYANFYHSQTGLPLEHQQQMPRDQSLGVAQGQQQPKQPQQIWQNSY